MYLSDYQLITQKNIRARYNILKNSLKWQMGYKKEAARAREFIPYGIKTNVISS